jgi:hypothetical protein
MTMRANRLRVYFAAMAYVLTHGLRPLGLQGTELKRAQASTIRLRLLKIGAQIRIGVRRVWLSGAEDATIAVRCRTEGRILITLDLDFANIRAYPPAEYAGIIILRSKK